MTHSRAISSNELLEACGWLGERPPRVLVFVAHPDDETIGLGAHLSALPDVVIVHATDGAPRNLKDARALGFANAATYAEARRRELRAAMALVGVGSEALVGLGFPDQEASLNLTGLIRSFADLLARRRPDLVLTHAYEGGHPDHDAVVFAARAALRLHDAQGGTGLIEMPYYHSRGGAPVRQRFASVEPAPIVIPLLPAARELKRRMLACHATQRETLSLFHVDYESFRRTASIDFSEPPNDGEVCYESVGCNLTAAEFLTLVRAALDELGLPRCL